MSVRELKPNRKQKVVADVALVARKLVEPVINYIRFFLLIWLSQCQTTALAAPAQDFNTLNKTVMRLIAAQHHESQCIPLLEQIIKFKVTPDNKEDIANAHYYLGRLYFDIQNNSDEAVKQETEAINLQPRKLPLADLYFLRGVYRSQSNQFDESMKDLQHSLVLRPKDPVTLYRLGNVYAIQKKDAQAIATYSKVLTLLPPSHKAYQKCLFGRAQLYKRNKQYQKAVDDFTALGKIAHPEGVRLARAYCYEKLHQFDKAMADYNDMVSYDPDNDDARRARGNCLLGMGKTKEALEDYDRAINSNPTSTNYKARSLAYEKIGRKDLAAADKQKANQ
jgi:serine/threonine-protein kinase